MTGQLETDDGQTSTNTVDEGELIDEIERIVRQTKKAYGYQHLSAIGTGLRVRYPDFSPKQYGYKKLLDLIEAHPDRFKIKWSAPAHKGKSYVWVRLATEPKRKKGYAMPSVDKAKPKQKPRLMTAQEFARLCEWLEGPKGCYFRTDPNSPDGMTWTCDGSLRKTKQWLRRRPFLSIDGNVRQIRQLGGYCDCEVLFNAVGCAIFSDQGKFEPVTSFHRM